MASTPQPSSSSLPAAPPVSQPAQSLEPTDFKLFKSPTTFAAPAVLPDEYFTPTAADLKAAQSTLAARTQALVNAPLQLRTAREAETKAKRDRWPQTNIRIKFTDRTQLEKSFPSTNKIRAVYAFVRSCLREDVKPIKFILYQPPKRDLKVSDPTVRDLTLSELQLSPSSVLLLRFEDEALNHVDVPAPLSEFVLSQAIDLPQPVSTPDLPPTSSSKPSQNKPVSSSSGEAKIPKWLKLGNKK
ncbi:hypothetical protein HYPSUDRAFT_73008 [Hypholoma sublateritium FD-334 SS-4]|uniref:UBX domain-containing protein n=1 Tax=Hypholoma sublateritium (strain FD-334 SS-4) TaxID=945553 RepID=A0A0D2LRI2_HYPSF|nr:hypothetical protein HYPSUDRAFT_73008 [Hypholoma sublateritium FD-334 SS-4]